MIAHVEINSGYPWINEFFGHPHEYWPIYLIVSWVFFSFLYFDYRIRRLQDSVARGVDEQ